MVTAVAALPIKAAIHFKRRYNAFISRWPERKRALTRKYYTATLLPHHHLPETSLAELNIVASDIVPLIMDDICMPPYYSFLNADDPQLLKVNDHDDINPLLAIAVSLNAQVIVELGTAHGNTTANLCRQCPTAKIYTVNAPAEEQTGETITFALTRTEAGRVYREHGLSDQVVQIYRNTLELDLSEWFDHPNVDFAIIDACHDTSYVINDFLKVQPFVKPGGIVLLHDTHPSMENHLIGSYAACMKLRSKGFDIRHLQNTWWGVWVNK